MFKKLLSKFNIKNKEDFYKVVKQFIKFGIVGVSNTLLSLAIYYILIFINVNYLIANIIAFIISVLNAYYWNNKYVFKNNDNSTFKKLIKVYLSYGITFVLSTVLLYVMVDLMNISKYIAPIINLLITIPLNFLLNKLWAFKKA